MIDHTSYAWITTINPYLFVLLGIIGFFIHFIPSFIAFLREHRYRMIIFSLNIILGWTGIVWIVLLFWSLNSDARVPV